MKTADLTITELAASAPKAVRDTEKLGVRGITRNGRAVAFLVSREVMESILETMELQKNSQLMKLVKADRAGKLSFTKVPDQGWAKWLPPAGAAFPHSPNRLPGQRD